MKHEARVRQLPEGYRTFRFAIKKLVWLGPHAPNEYAAIDAAIRAVGEDSPRSGTDTESTAIDGNVRRSV